MTYVSAAVPVLVVKAVSLVPSLLRRAMRLTGDPPQWVKLPPTRILPSDWTAMAKTYWLAAAPVLVVKAVSRVPSELSRAM